MFYDKYVNLTLHLFYQLKNLIHYKLLEINPSINQKNYLPYPFFVHRMRIFDIFSKYITIDEA